MSVTGERRLPEQPLRRQATRHGQKEVGMEFYGVLDQIIDLLQCRGRVSYRALKRQFHLDEDYLEDLKEAILYAHAQVIVDDGRGFVWRGDAPLRQADGRHETEAERRFHALLPGVIALLRQERRVTYRTLKYVFGLDETFLEDVRRELGFKRLALDEDGEGLVWTGEGQPAVLSVAAPPTPACSSSRSRRGHVPCVPREISPHHEDRAPARRGSRPTRTGPPRPRRRTPPADRAVL